jgi:transposase
MRVARKIVLNPQSREILQRLARARSLPARVVERARIVLRAAAGLQDREIAAQLGITPEKAARWRNRFLNEGLAALEKDAPRPGRKPKITAAKVREVVEKTTLEEPGNAPAWSTRAMAKATGLSEASIRRIWRAHGLKPHLSKTGSSPIPSPSIIVNTYDAPFATGPRN